MIAWRSALPDLLAALQPTREQAQDAARRELSRPEYADAEPPLLVQALNRVLQELAELLDSASARLSSPLARILLLALLAGLAVVVLVRLGPLARGDRRPGSLFEAGRVVRASDHRGAAEAAAAQQRWAEAVRERLRAVVRELEERGVLDARPSRTAAEVARDGGAAVPALAPELQQAARVFDEIWYGNRPATEDGYRTVVAVDERVRSAAPVA